MTDPIHHDRILLPTDGSDCAKEAMRHAIDIARRYDAALYVIHVVNTGVAASGMDIFSAYNAGQLFDELEDAGREIVDAAVEEAQSEGIESVEGAVLDGAPDAEILKYIDDHDIDLVVMGTHGRRGLSRALLGSVTEKVVRLAPVPVFTIHTSDTEKP
ncbi:MAG TPA: universal stress protein [Halococcus sp.]|nr:universal stress protein [Halococcus sp.]